MSLSQTEFQASIWTQPVSHTHTPPARAFGVNRCIERTQPAAGQATAGLAQFEPARPMHLDVAGIGGGAALGGWAAAGATALPHPRLSPTEKPQQPPSAISVREDVPRFEI